MMHIIREMLDELQQDIDNEKITAGKLMARYVEYWINRQHSKKIVSAFEGNERTKRQFITEFFTDLASKIYLTEKLSLGYEEIVQLLVGLSLTYPIY